MKNRIYATPAVKRLNTKHHLYMFCAILPRNAKRQYLLSLCMYLLNLQESR